MSYAQKNQLKLGVSPLSWVNEVLLDLGEGTTATTILREAAGANFQGVEMSRAFPSDAQELKELLTQHELQFISGWYSGFLAERDVDEEFEAAQSYGKFMRACGADVMVYGECAHMATNALDVPLSERLTLTEEAINPYGEKLSLFAKMMRDEFGLNFAYHHHLMMVAETHQEIQAIMRHSADHVGLLLDTGHAFAGGFDYRLLIDEFGDRIRHIHLKDVRADVMRNVREQHISFNDGVRMGMFTVPGDGDVDFAPLAQFLTDGNYQGWLVVEAEQDPQKAPPAETVARAHQFVQQHIYPHDIGDAS